MARNRGVSETDAATNFGKGRMVSAENALKVGMVDRVETMQATIERLLTEMVTNPIHSSAAQPATGQAAASVVEEAAEPSAANESERQAARLREEIENFKRSNAWI